MAPAEERSYRYLQRCSKIIAMGQSLGKRMVYIIDSRWQNITGIVTQAIKPVHALVSSNFQQIAPLSLNAVHLRRKEEK